MSRIKKNEFFENVANRRLRNSFCYLLVGRTTSFFLLPFPIETTEWFSIFYRIQNCSDQSLTAITKMKGGGLIAEGIPSLKCRGVFARRLELAAADSWDGRVRCSFWKQPDFAQQARDGRRRIWSYSGVSRLRKLLFSSLLLRTGVRSWITQLNMKYSVVNK